MLILFSFSLQDLMIIHMLCINAQTNAEDNIRQQDTEVKGPSQPWGHRSVQRLDIYTYMIENTHMLSKVKHCVGIEGIGNWPYLIWFHYRLHLFNKATGELQLFGPMKANLLYISGFEAQNERYGRHKAIWLLTFSVTYSLCLPLIQSNLVYATEHKWHGWLFWHYLYLCTSRTNKQID